MRAVQWLLIGLLLTGWLVVPVQAQDNNDEESEEPKPVAKIGEPAPEIEAEFTNADGDVSIEKYKGRIVLLFFFRTDDAASMEAFAILNGIHKKFGNRGVVIIGMTKEERDTAEGLVNGKKAEFIIGYKAENDESYKVAAVPEVYMVDTRGVLTNRFHPADQFEDRLLAQFEMTPPAGADLEALEAKFGRARKWYHGKEYGKAFTLLKELGDVVDNSSTLGGSVSKLKDDVESASKDWLEEARTAIRTEKFEVAARILAELSVRFRGEEVADDAENEIGRVMGRREAKNIMKTALENAKGEVLNDEAANYEAVRRFLEARRLYRQTSEEHPDTQAAKVAEEAIERINADPVALEIIKKHRADAQASRWLDIGDRYAKVEMYTDARDYYQRVVDEYPTTRAGSQAKERLRELPEEEPEETEVAASDDGE